MKGEEGEEDEDDEEDNWPELRYGIYKNPKPGPSWRLEPGEYYDPATFPIDSYYGAASTLRMASVEQTLVSRNT